MNFAQVGSALERAYARVRFFYTCRPLKLHIHMVGLLFFAFGTWLMWHTFGYDHAHPGIEISGTLWSDFTAHINVIRSFTRGDNWPPEYPLFPNAPVKYHFGFYAVVGYLEKLGIPLDWALNIPSSLSIVLLAVSLFVLALRLFPDVRVAWLSMLFLLLNGSGSIYFYFKDKTNYRELIERIPTLREYICFGPWSKCQVSAFWNWNVFTNQRHLALGLGSVALFAACAAKWSAEPTSKISYRQALLGIGIGLLYSFHKPSLLIAALFIAVYFVILKGARKASFVVGTAAVVSIVLQLLYLGWGSDPSASGDGAVFRPGFLSEQPLTTYGFFYYWFINLGVHFVLMPLGFLLAPARVKKVFLPVIAVAIVGNTYIFASDPATNHKFFNLTIEMGNILSAWIIVRLWDGMNQPAARAIMRSVAVLLVLAGTASGVADLFPIINDQRGVIPDSPVDPMVTWITDHTPPRSVFLNERYIYSAASVAGRRILMPWPYFVSGIGYNIDPRIADSRIILAGGNMQTLCDAIARNKIDYIHIDEAQSDKNFPAANLSFYRSHFKPVFENPSNKDPVYDTKTMCGR